MRGRSPSEGTDYRDWKSWSKREKTVRRGKEREKGSKQENKLLVEEKKGSKRENSL